MTQQLEIDLVPYDVEQPDPNTMVMVSEYYADKLRIKSRFTEKYAGFYHGENFVTLDIDNDENTLTFTCRNEPMTLDIVADFFDRNIHAIDEIGYECLYPEPV